jgi:hypothetical protein
LGFAKFDPPHTLSGSDRIHEAISGLPLARDMLEIAKDESSSSPASSPDPSEGALPLVDNQDIESFQMVHIQSQNASADMKATSPIIQFLEEDAFPFRKIGPWQPSFSRDLTVDFALMKVIQTVPSTNSGGNGFIYICWHESSSRVIKIGRTTDVMRRLQERSRHCRGTYKVDPQLYNGTKMVVPFVGKVEKLIHTELENYRVRMDCNGCGLTHYEWFRVSKEHVMKVFQKWKDWMSQESYMQTDDGRWVLKPSFLVQTREVCRPLAMKE